MRSTSRRPPRQNPPGHAGSKAPHEKEILANGEVAGAITPTRYAVQPIAHADKMRVMSHAMNPYAPPSVEGEGRRGASGTFSLKDNRLIAAKGAVLPAVCIWSGEEAVLPLINATLYWVPMWTIIFIWSPVIYLAVYFLVRKKALLTYGLGSAARKRQKQARIFGAGGMAVSALAMIVGIVLDSGALLIFGPVTFLFCLLFFMIRRRVIHVLRIDADSVHLRLRPAAAQAFSNLS